MRTKFVSACVGRRGFLRDGGSKRFGALSVGPCRNASLGGGAAAVERGSKRILAGAQDSPPCWPAGRSAPGTPCAGSPAGS